MARLKMVCQIDGVKHTAYCDLPENWESMSDEEKEEFEQECLEAHIINCVDAWTEVEP